MEAKKAAMSKSARKNAARKQKQGKPAAVAVDVDGQSGPATGASHGEKVGGEPTQASGSGGGDEDSQPSDVVAQEIQRHLKALRKKVRQVDELLERQAAGDALNSEQLAKVGRRNQIVAEMQKWEGLEAAGSFDPGKRLKNLRKKLRQVDELADRAEAGQELNEEQQAKLAGKDALVHEINELTQLFASVLEPDAR